VEDRDLLVHRAAAAGGHAGDDLRAVLAALARVERTLASGEALDHDAAVGADQNAHRPAATAFFAASSMPSAMVKFMPESARIFRPSSTLVPSRRATTGTWTPTWRTASTTPFASTSTRRMPPKMLISTALTLRSDTRMRNAAATCSALAPPPTSRKLAGE